MSEDFVFYALTGVVMMILVVVVYVLIDSHNPVYWKDDGSEDR